MWRSMDPQSCRNKVYDGTFVVSFHEVKMSSRQDVSFERSLDEFCPACGARNCLINTQFLLKISIHYQGDMKPCCLDSRLSQTPSRM